jgi:S-adenosylmethionine:tRNA ribosyltransferase-isomerase
MKNYTLSDFDFDLPNHLIAQVPADKRENSKLLIYKRETGTITHDVFSNITKHLPKESTLVFNNSKVIPARIFGKNKERTFELLITKINKNKLTALVRPGKKAKVGTTIELPEGLTITVEKSNDDGTKVFTTENPISMTYLEKAGQLPLPPYITGDYNQELAKRYQTLYAKNYGSIAAPTAGLHFSKEVLNKIQQNHTTTEVTLHVGLGTFAPIREEEIQGYSLHTEEYEITNNTAALLNKAKQNKHPIITVGTTSTRTLEANLKKDSVFTAGTDNTNIFIKPGYNFKAIDGMITNFHLPKSSLFILVSTLLGLETAQKIYAEAIKHEYRFYSFGDACLFI